MSKHVMFDIETLGLDSSAAIVSIGACRFDPRGDPSASLPAGLFERLVAFGPGNDKIDPATMLWWLQKDREVAARELLRQPRHDLAAVLSDFAFYIEGAEAIWSFPMFDEAILRAACDRSGVAWPLHPKTTRCCRTLFKELGASIGWSRQKDQDQLSAHSALNDAINQARAVQRLFAHLRKLTGTAPIGYIGPMVDP